MLIPNFSLWTWYLILQAGSFLFGGSTIALIMYRSGMTWSLFLQLAKDLSKKEEFSIFVLMMALPIFCALFPCLGYISFAKELRGKQV